MDPIIIKPVNSHSMLIRKDGNDYLYLHPTYLRIIGRGEADDFSKDELIPVFKKWDFDTTIVKSAITSITMSFHVEQEAYSVMIEYCSGSNDLVFSDRDTAKDLLNKILLWYHDPEEYFK